MSCPYVHEDGNQVLYTREIQILSKEIKLLQMDGTNLRIPNTMKLLSKRISDIRSGIYRANLLKEERLTLPNQKGPILTSIDKLFFTKPVNLGKILGPEGRTIKQIEKVTGCKLAIRGKGTPRKNKKQFNPGDPDDILHIIISIEDTEERALIRINKVKECISKLLDMEEEDVFASNQVKGLKEENSTLYNLLPGDVSHPTTFQETPSNITPITTIQQGVLISTNVPLPITHYHSFQPFFFSTN